jgi:8-oxo-dGTP pyrophosphatase MutT (NUDIX family)
MQMLVQLNIYREKDGQFEYLLLKRITGNSSFWQVVTQPVHSGDTLGDTLRDAASEQVGLHGFKHLSHETYSYEWYANGERGRDIVFAAEVRPEATVTPDPQRYEDFAWLPINEAAQRLKWDGNRTALRQLDTHLIEKRAASLIATPGLHLQQAAPTSTMSGIPLGSDIPTPYQEDYYQIAHIPVANAPTAPDVKAASPANASHSPYGPNVPRRLPDVPSAVAAPVREINPGELFL